MLADEQFPREDELESRQAAGLYPVGRVLRQTFNADNHDSLGTELTGLMLQLARVDPDGKPLPRGTVPVEVPAAVTTPEPVPAPRRPWWRTAVTRLLGR